MPRAKPRIGTTEFRARPHETSGSTRLILVGLLGLGDEFDERDDRHVQVISEVEKWLGFHAPARETASNLPRPADYKRALTALDEDGDIPLDEERFHKHILDIVRSAQIGDESRQRSEIKADIRSELAAHAGMDGRGRPPKDYLFKLIKELRKTFFRFYERQPQEEVESTGCIKRLTNKEFDECQFVERLALCCERLTVRMAR